MPKKLISFVSDVPMDLKEITLEGQSTYIIKYEDGSSNRFYQKRKGTYRLRKPVVMIVQDSYNYNYGF